MHAPQMLERRVYNGCAYIYACTCAPRCSTGCCATAQTRRRPRRRASLPCTPPPSPGTSSSCGDCTRPGRRSTAPTRTEAPCSCRPSSTRTRPRPRGSSPTGSMPTTPTSEATPPYPWPLPRGTWPSCGCCCGTAPCARRAAGEETRRSCARRASARQRQRDFSSRSRHAHTAYATHVPCARHAHAMRTPCCYAHAMHMLCTCYAARRGGRA